MSEFEVVAKIDEIEEGVVKVVRVGDAPIGVTKVEGELFAFADADAQRRVVAEHLLEAHFAPDLS